MSSLRALLFIDPKNIWFKIYQEVESKNWQVLFEINYSISDKTMFEVLSLLFSRAEEFGVGEWSVYSCNLSSDINDELSLAISMPIKSISIAKKYEILFKGLLTEF
jgi:hypothetical protein